MQQMYIRIVINIYILPNYQSSHGQISIRCMFLVLKIKSWVKNKQTCHDPVFGIGYNTNTPLRFLGLQYPLPLRYRFQYLPPSKPKFDVNMT